MQRQSKIQKQCLNRNIYLHQYQQEKCNVHLLKGQLIFQIRNTDSCELLPLHETNNIPLNENWFCKNYCIRVIFDTFFSCKSPSENGIESQVNLQSNLCKYVLSHPQCA